MKLKFILVSNLIIIAVLLMWPVLYRRSSLAWSDGVSDQSDKQIVRVYFPDRYTANKISISFEEAILETNYEKRYHIMTVTPDEMAFLTSAGLKIETVTHWTPKERLTPQGRMVNGIAGFPFYETVEETYALTQAIADENLDLASWIDVGDSWEKTEGLGGYDLMVLVLTNSATSGNKPKFFAAAAIHAR